MRICGAHLHVIVQEALRSRSRILFTVKRPLKRRFSRRNPGKSRLNPKAPRVNALFLHFKPGEHVVL
jgi:hypothetical protein